MIKLVILAFTLSYSLIAQDQSLKRTPHKVPGNSACPPGAICFSGEVSEGHEFHKKINDELEFVLEGSWGIAVVPTRTEGDCREFASVVNAPYRAHRSLYIDTSYGWTAEAEVSYSPREFRFVTNCGDYRTESGRLNIVMWPYTATQQKYEEAMAQLGASPLGTGRLWITDSKIDHSRDTPGDKLGEITWMRFSVEIRLPTP